MAAFASFYAHRNYVKDELSNTAQLMSLVKKWRRGSMTKQEWKLWINSTIIPVDLLMRLKKIKNVIGFC